MPPKTSRKVKLSRSGHTSSHSGDWEAVAPSRCDPVRGQRVTYIAPSDCFGGAEPPEDHWEPCPGVSWYISVPQFLGNGFIAAMAQISSHTT